MASLAGGTAVARWGAVRVSQAVLCAAGLALCAVPLLAHTMPAHRMSLVFSIKEMGVPLGGVLAGLTVPGAA